MNENAEVTPGPGVDRFGRPVVDPTENVLQLVAAAIQRQDDLRAAEARHLREIEAMRAESLRNERAHLRELAEQRAEYDNRLHKAEANRIDAIRAVDVTAVQQTAAAAETRATALAAVVTASAEALRNQVSEVRQASDLTLAQALAPISEAISDLRRAQYQAQGEKTQVVEQRAQVSGVQAFVATVVTILTLMIAGLGIYLSTHQSQPVTVNPVVTVPTK